MDRRALLWKSASNEASYYERKIDAIKKYLGVNDDGSADSLSIRQWLQYGTPRMRLVSKLEVVRKAGEQIAVDLFYVKYRYYQLHHLRIPYSITVARHHRE
jgi:hypothetical protein